MADLDSLAMDLGGAPAMARASTGWSALGQALGGGGLRTQNAFITGQLRGAQIANVLEQARMRRDKNLAIQSITPEALADPTQRSAIAAAVLRAGGDPNHLAEYDATNQKSGIQAMALQNALSNTPDLNLGNRLSQAYTMKPVDLSTVQGGTLINQFVTPDEQAAYGGNTPTAVGQSEIAKALAGAKAEDARAAASYASAARQRAGIGADKASNYELVDTADGLVRVNKLDPTDATPVTSGTGSAITRLIRTGGAGGGRDIPSPATLKQVFGEPKVGGEPNEAAQDFLSWQALQAQTDPAYNNGDYALQQYLLRQSGAKHAANATASDADALGLTNITQNRANATGTRQTDEAGNAVLPLATTSAIGKAFNAKRITSPANDTGTSPTTIRQSDVSKLPAPKSQAEYDALPVGAAYLYTDGTVQVKGR